MTTSTTTLRCWEIRAGIPTGDGRMADCSTPEVIGDARYHATEVERNAAGWMRCESGEWSEVRCESVEPLGDLVTVRWVPECGRETAAKAGSWRGLSRTSRVCAWCAEHMQDVDAGWVREVRK